ncbi:Calx-beta domain-containing protein [Brevundimonas faecalis]|uniref:DUF7507 domain-containing protein n=1 Tax=Brevundimonas faecalis TaxID=947378 RepID=UPI00361DCC97
MPETTFSRDASGTPSGLLNAPDGKESRRRRSIAGLFRAAAIGALAGVLGGLTVLSSGGAALAQQRSILNTSFEDQNPNGPGAPSFQLFNPGAVTGWKAVANSNNQPTQIELWDSGFQGVPSYDGVVHAEMNANLPGALYQEVCFTTGESIGWFFAHRARSGGANPQIANFEIANASGTVLQTLASQSSPIDNVWRTNSGTGVYTGPTGVQRIQFRTTNPGSVGNFLDAIQIDLAAYAEFASATTSALEGAANPTVPSITVTGKVDQAVVIPLTIAGGTATAGVDYTLSPASITIPAGNYNRTLFPIPLTIINDKDIEADETVIVRLGTPSNPEIFLANTGCSGNPVLQATHTILNDDVDLRTNKTLASANASPAEGDTVSFQIAVTNLGARAATGVVLTDQLPAGMTFVAANASLGSYNSGSGVWTLGDLAAGTTATLTLTGTVNTGQAGAVLTNTTTAATGANVDDSRTAGDDLTESVVVNTTSGLAVTKSGVLNRGPDNTAGVGDVITYSFTVRNTGTSPLTNVMLTERLPGAVLSGGPIANLPRGSTDTSAFTATYTLTQADVDRGRVENIVEGTGRDGTGATLTATGQTVTPIQQTAGLSIAKTQVGGPTTVTAAGQTLTYSIVMRNTGNITQTNARVIDTLPNASSSTLGGQTESILADGLLQPGETWTYTAVYVTSQADVDGGAPLVNSALASSDQSSPVSATATTLVSRNPQMVVTKQVDRTSISQPGVLNYVITLRNAGNVTLTGISVADALPNGAAATLSGPTGDGGTPGALDVGETWTYTTTYSVSQAEIQAGTARVNTVTARTAQINSPLTATATTTISRNPAVSIDKTVDKASISAPGALTYTVTVRNTGDVSLTGVTVSDTLPDGTPGTLSAPTGDGGVAGVLDVGETWTYAATFTATQAQIDAGTALVNTARVTTVETPSPITDTATTTIAASPALTVRKTVDRASITAPGTLNYTITVSNTGNVSLTNVTPTDTLPNGSSGALVGPAGDGGVIGVLDVGETWTYTTAYSVAQAEIDTGADRTNTVSVVSTQTPTPVTSAAVTTIQRSPSVAIDKTVDQASISAPGQLTYSIVVRNTGNTALNNVVVSDVLPDGTPGPLTGPTGDGGVSGVLDVGENWTYAATFNATQAQIDAGAALVNTARVTTTETPTPVADTATTAVSQRAAFRIDKTVDQAVISTPGVLHYVIRVINTGNVSLDGVVPVDTLPDGSIATLSGPTGDGGQIGFIDVGETWTYTTSYSVDQARIEAGGTLVNSVSVTTNQTTAPQDDAVTSIARYYSLSIDKTVDKTRTSTVGEVLNYVVTLRNTGNVALSGLNVSDTLNSATDLSLSGPVGDTNGDNRLDVGETWTYTTSYVVTQADIDSGAALVNVARATSTETPVPVTDNATTGVNQNSGIVVEKDVDKDSVAVAGTLTYTIRATNIGNTTLSNVDIVDTLPNGAPATLIGPTGDGGTPNEIDPGETWIWTTTYTVTQSDLNTGADLINNVSVATTDPGGTPTDSDSASTTLVRIPGMSVTKTVDRPRIAAPGPLNYTVTVANTGNVSLTGVVPTDTLPDGSTVILSAPSGDGGVPGVLDVGETWTYAATFNTTQTQIDAGTPLINNVSVTSSETATPVAASATTTIDGAPGLRVTKTVNRTAVSAPGALNYTITVANTGNVSLTGVTPTDTLPDGTPGTLTGPSGDGGVIGALDVGETWTYTTTFNTTQGQIDAGTPLVNTISVVTAQTPTPLTATATTTVTAAPGLSVTKTVDQTAVSAPGVLNYTITVANTGNVSLTGVVPTDTLPDGTPGTLTGPTGDSNPLGVLDVGETWTYTAAFNTTQGQIDAGAPLVNTISVVTAQTPTPLAATATTTVTAAPDLIVTKTVDRAAIASPGVLNYVIRLRNAGNVSLTNVAPVDTLPDGTPGPLTGPTGDGGVPGVLDVGETWTYTAAFNATQAQIDAGAPLVNALSVTTSQTQTPRTASATTTVADAPAVLVAKTVDQTLVSSPTTLTYLIRATNVGNRSLNAVTLNDVLSNGGAVNVGAPQESLAGGTPGVLDVGETWTWTATYDLTQADIDAGTPLTNTATVDTDLTPSQDATARTAISDMSELRVEKDVDLQQINAPGVLTYVIRVTNGGNTRLSNPVLTDTLSNGAAVTLGAPSESLPGGTAGVLDVGETWTYVATYAVTAADIDAGADLINTASATAQRPSGGALSAEDAATTLVSRNIGLELIKTGVLNLGGDGRLGAGDVVDFAFSVLNTGNTTLENITLTDTLPGVTTSGGPIASLAAGAVDATTFTARYVLTQADIDAGRITNPAFVSGATSDGATTTAEDEVTLALTGSPALSLEKTGALNQGANGRADVGDPVAYAFTVTNVGNVTLNNVAIRDALPGIVLNGGPIPSLAPGASDAVTFTATYALTQADIDAGQVVNTAVAEGEDASGNPVDATDGVTIPVVGAPAVAATKTAALTTDRATQGVGNAGDVITYTVTATNTGNTTLENLVIGDVFQGGAETALTCTPATLAPGATVACAAYTHEITQDEANAGAPLRNAILARANALGRPGVSVTAQAATETPVEADPTDLQIFKTAAPRDVKIGDLVRYTVTIVNIGTVDAVDVTVTDTPPPGFSYVDGSLSVDDADDAFRLAGVNPIRVDQVDVPVGQRATVVYLLRVGAGVRPGSHVNSVIAEDGPRRSNIATAEVRLTSDPLLDESLVVGTVFDDRDGDGRQDEGEPGIPGVRIASVEGLIVETDQFGRYHLVGVDGGPWERGRNFILKVDPVTLPPGSRFSTDNPLLRRVTPGLPVRFDFGVVLPQAAASTSQEVRP